MIEPARVYAATLAAGLARRFGADKLSERYGEGSVLEAALAPLDRFQWLGQGVVTRAGRAIHGRQIIANDAPERGMGHSLALAAGAAETAGADFLLVTLGDMPCVSAETIAGIIAACPDRADALLACKAEGAAPGPPALFGKSWFERLRQAGGDTGARSLLRDPARGVMLIPLPDDEARDIDTPADLRAMRLRPKSAVQAADCHSPVRKAK